MVLSGVCIPRGWMGFNIFLVVFYGLFNPALISGNVSLAEKVVFVRGKSITGKEKEKDQYEKRYFINLVDNNILY
jgi:hypothetical protein